ncbi:sugar kinase [Brachybacterium vulturis]|uniref:Sugar kinase n=1 Tax=Brachybacterium vulturis TaxID=2017484 RepID=A0A291GLY1_9MICO|nr:FGGY family carbohydrate kinase [Brachybacterium vulturis]ATG51187.1 sugar kinase [Brachybacterium vulturis]
MPSLLCLDLGTSAAKAALIDLDGNSREQASSEYPTRRTADGGAEQDPGDWVRAARTAIAQILPSPAAGDDLLALSLTGQMQDLVLETEGESEPPAILYSDTRAGAEAEELRAQLAAEGIAWDALTANQQDASSCAAMFRRLDRVDPGLARRVRQVVFGPAGHLVHRLGLGAWCDLTTAAATGLLDHRTRTWSAPVARAAGLAAPLLPALTHRAGQILGRTGASAPALLGLPAGLPVVLAPGDAGATTLGIVGLTPGDDYAYLGTSGWRAVVQPAAPPSQVGTSHHLALGGSDHGASDHGAGPTLRISALLAAGAVADWGREALLGGATPGAADALLEGREHRHGRGPTGLLALPSILGERYPVRDADLRGAMIGIGPQTRAIDLYAAMLEGVAHALAHGDDGATSRPLAVTGGGTASQPWLRIIADVTGRPVHTVDGADAALLGCALAAADELGLEHRIMPLAARADGRSIAPDPAAAAAHRALRPAHRALYTAVAEVQALR